MSIVMDDIRYFNTVATTLNMTRASEILGITQPALSYAIKRLERELGGDLFIRLKNGVQLSRLGEEFLRQGQLVLFEWEQAQKIVENLKSEVAGKFILGMHPSVALYSLEHFLPQILKAHPKLEFTIVNALSREVTEQVISWKIDFGIVVNPKAHPDLVIKELCQDKVSLFESDQNQGHLIYDAHINQSLSLLKKMKRDKKQKSDLTCENLEVIAKLASLGLGQAILPQRVAKHYGNLKIVKSAPTVTDRICLIYRKEKQKSFAAKAIIKAIQII